MAVQDNEGGTALRLFEYAESSLDQIDVVRGADAQDIPPVSQKSSRDVFGERDFCAAFDRDVIVVIDPAQVIETEVTGE